MDNSAKFLEATRLVADLHQRASSDRPALLRDLIEAAATAVPGAEYAGVTVSQKRRLSHTAAATHRYPVMLDEIQSRHQQGPSLTAAERQDSIRIDDLHADARWPLYRDHALNLTPIRSILSYGMFRDGGTTAALSFYAEPVNAFEESSVDLGLVFATHTALVWNLMRRDQQFRSALVSRDVIGQAKGRLMERFGVNAEDAFHMLKQISQESNTPITHIAQHIASAATSALLEQAQ